MYHRLAASALFLTGIERLQKGIKTYQVALMCSEENPLHCHRHLLISRVLSERAVEVIHIRKDGSTQTYTQLQHHVGNQGELFDDTTDSDWKSKRPIS